MRIEPLFRTLIAGGWPAAWQRYPEYFAGMIETYGPEIFGPGGLPALAGRISPHVLQHLQRVAHLDWEGWSAALVRQAYRLLPGPPAPLYLGTLLGLAPAATLGVSGEPAIAVGLERFGPEACPQTQPPRWLYRPEELAEMIPHEAAHATRFRALGLPPSPRHLPLSEMLLLEGTALLFADWLLGKETIRSFLPATQLARLQSLEPALLAGVLQELHVQGMPAFHRYFSASAPVSGYYLGWALARRYQAATGQDTVSVLLTPTRHILATVLR